MKQANIDKLKALVGERTDDDALAILEVINDVDEVNESQWEEKFRQNDADWRKRYANAFNNTDIKPVITQLDDEETEAEKEERRLQGLKLSDFF